MEEFEKASCIRGLYVIIGHPSLANDLYVKMSQIIQEIDMLSQFIK